VLSSRLGLCESSFLLLEYSVELRIEYSSTRLIPEVAMNCRVAKNKRMLGSSFKLSYDNGLKWVKLMQEMLKNPSQAKSLICKLYIRDENWRIIVTDSSIFFICFFFISSTLAPVTRLARVLGTALITTASLRRWMRTCPNFSLLYISHACR